MLRRGSRGGMRRCVGGRLWLLFLGVNFEELVETSGAENLCVFFSFVR